MKPQEFNYDKIIIGSSLEAFLFSYFNKIKVMYTRNNQPDSFERIKEFGLGTNKRDIWNKYAFQLSLSGYIPFSDSIKHIQYISNNTLKVVTREDHVYTVSYKQLYVFDDYNFFDIPVSTSSTSVKYRVIDTFSYNSKKLDKENIQSENDFLNQIIFHNTKKITTVSFVEKDEIDNFQHHLIKIKLESLLNIRSLNLDHQIREIIDLGQNVYDDFENVIFVYTDAELIYLFHRKNAKIDYLKYLKLKMEL